MADNLDGVDPQLANIARKIIAESGGKITISSGFRTREEQQALYDAYINGTGNLAAKPGSSMHEHGGAIDFGGDMQLLAQLARKYGLVNSVPGEPWHWTLTGEDGSHTTRFNEMDLSPENASRPEDVLGNRLHSVLSILGQSTNTSLDSVFDDAQMNQEFAPVQRGGESFKLTPAGPKGQLQQYARRKMADYGFDESEISALVQLWDRESGWNPQAQNPTSTAFGIAQFLNGTWAGTGYKKTTDPYQQIDAGLKYIQGRYGTPSRALQFHDENGYY